MTLKPLMSALTLSRAAFSNISSCVASVSKIQSRENSMFLTETDFCCPRNLLTSIAPRVSPSLSGLNRANTPMLSLFPAAGAARAKAMRKVWATRCVK